MDVDDEASRRILARGGDELLEEFFRRAEGADREPRGSEQELQRPQQRRVVVHDAHGRCLDHRHGATVQLVDAARYRTLYVGPARALCGFCAERQGATVHAPNTEKVASWSTTATAIRPVFSAMAAIQPRPPSPPCRTRVPAPLDTDLISTVRAPSAALSERLAASTRTKRGSDFDSGVWRSH